MLPRYVDMGGPDATFQMLPEAFNPVGKEYADRQYSAEWFQEKQQTLRADQHT